MLQQVKTKSVLLLVIAPQRRRNPELVMPLRLALVCHAPTHANRASSFPKDEPLDASGLEKAHCVSQRFDKALRYLRSPAIAAQQTAEAMDIHALVESELRECDYGHWAGMSINDIAASDRDGLSQWLNDPTARPHGGEALVSLVRRVNNWLDQQQGDGTVVAITHVSIVRAAIVCALDAPPLAFWRIDISPLSVTWLSRSSRPWTLSATNKELTRKRRS
jgi:broad specificity phosphatase PhoE